MGMSDQTWKRHANPLSVWTRVPVLPLLALAIWSRAWIGVWCLLPIGMLVVWTVFNPRAFPIPVSTDNWASKATFGERVWLNRKTVPIPAHHDRFSLLLNIGTTLGIIPLAYGLFEYNLWATLLGLVVVVGGKLWFLDRMVWLYQDMKDENADYASWLY
ncbi:MAG: hypothetical protein JKY32_11780 [Rhizobiales bacterium]|nr:hypothetical protein [Hyphomicrobiales bacterium]